MQSEHKICMYITLPDSSVHGILQARILELPLPSPGNLPKPGIEPIKRHFSGDRDYRLITIRVINYSFNTFVCEERYS